MLDLHYVVDELTGEQWLETGLSGKALLTTPLLNKGTAFTLSERKTFELEGKLPLSVDNLSHQVERAYAQYVRYQTELSRNIYLNNLRDRNESLFYCLLSQHIEEMMPIIYTPTVGSAVKEFSREFRQPRGLYLSYPDLNNLDKLLDNRSHPEVDLLVVTDGAGVLGIGDQGVGAMDIPIAKLMVYSLFGGVHPSRTLPIMLDVGTDNEELLADPLYLGWRHRRIDKSDYDDFIAQFVAAIQQRFPRAFIHWEDLGQNNASRVLSQYREKICTFNDDIQGTGAVAVAGVLAALQGTGRKLIDQNLVIFGAGTAGIGIAEQLLAALQRGGLSLEQARDRLWLVDKVGLLTTETDTTDVQAQFAKHADRCRDMPRDSAGKITVETVIDAVQPSVLIGCSARAYAFHETMIRHMASYCERPIIFPLSNPTECSEAHPIDLLRWSEGRAIIATGSPFQAVTWQSEPKVIPQSNNALIFPGLGLGVLACRAKRLSDQMIVAACEALASKAPILECADAATLPPLVEARTLSMQVALAVMKQARIEGLQQIDDQLDDELRLANMVWKPGYLPIKKK